MSPPMIMNTFTNDGVVFRHREYIDDLVVDGTTKFTVRKTLSLNPGLVDTFPWLAGISENWKEYEWHGIIVEYKPLTALATTTGAGAMGSVMIGTHYDMYEKPFEDKQEMLNSEFTTSGKPQLAQIHPIECKRSQTPVSRKWIRTPSDVIAGSDLRLYDHARVEIATEGIPVGEGVTSAKIGELWITFEVCCYKPKLVDKRKFQVEQDVETFRLVDSSTGTTAIPWFDVGLPFGTAANHISDESSMNGTFCPGGTGVGGTSINAPVYIFNPGEVSEGDIFRILVYASSTEIFQWGNGSKIVFGRMESYLWFARPGISGGTNVIAAPNTGTENGNHIAEYYVRIQPFSSSTPPYFYFTGTATWDSTDEADWILMVHKIMNKPRNHEELEDMVITGYDEDEGEIEIAA